MNEQQKDLFKGFDEVRSQQNKQEETININKEV